jgi:hypothetical protein
MHMLLAVFHILFVAPLFFYIAFVRSDMPIWFYNVLLVLGLGILLYHGWKFIVRYMAKSSGAWVNAIHVFLVAPLLIYIGYMKKDTPRAAYELSVMTGFGALGYHLYSLVTQLQIAGLN